MIPALDEEEGEDDIKMGVTTEGDRFVELGKKKRATVRMFKGAFSSLDASAEYRYLSM